MHAYLDTNAHAPKNDLWKVIVGASLGTVFEWYDFFCYGLLAAILSRTYFSSINETSAFIVTLLSFAAGTAIRPLGALVFGRFGDIWGRKRTFLITITLMGLATFCIGLLPGYASWGALAAFILVILRMLQGFALGGEYGGAAIYVAEHAPAKHLGFYTSWIQITTPLGQLTAMLVILGVQAGTTPQDFVGWGWRIPFLLSIVLLVVSIWIRSSLHESPVFRAMEASGRLSKAPLKETFGRWRNLRTVLIALFGLAAGQAVVIVVGMTYSFFFLTQTIKVDLATGNMLLAIALVATAPLFVAFGALSDKIGCKPIIFAGLVLSLVFYRPIFQGLTHFANPALEAASQRAPVTVVADPANCSFQFNPIGTTSFRSSCDIAKAFLSRAGVPYSNAASRAGTLAMLELNGRQVASFDGTSLPQGDFAEKLAEFNRAALSLIKDAGYPASADPSQINKPMVVILLSSLMLFATMVYGPMAAMLVGLFPPQIRYSSVSTAYHIGNGWFGGFTSPIAFALVAAFGDMYAGLWYCLAVIAVTLVTGILLLTNRVIRGVGEANPATIEATRAGRLS